MRHSKEKKTATAFSLLLISAIAISLIAIPTVTAQEEPTEVPSYPYINAIPNPIGVGQKATLHVGSLWPCGSVSTAGWEGLQVTIKKDGQTVETINIDRKELEIR